ncbi:MAG: Asp-tRNA(Asn)/Glu-tRNA(Gln) amidotransferase subunit GatB [bacterium]
MSTVWEPVIGLEIHVQLNCKSKIFSGSSTAYGAEPNTQTCPLDLGMPGTLPVLNTEAVHKAVLFGLAIDAKIGRINQFARKNYFYPDLPKGYQISQFDLPIVGKGKINIELGNGTAKTIGITRAHLEEDAGKSLHEDFHGLTGIDLNRAGTPLLEIVSEPDLRSAVEAVAYMRKIHTLVRYIGISDGNMQEGSFRCDANVSLRPAGQEKLGTRAELKNINSFRFVERAIDLEIERQAHILESGGEIVQETRLYDADKHETRSMRSKEEANDYRYFPDPDLLPIVIHDSDIELWRKELPELPDTKAQRYQQQLRLTAEEAQQLSQDEDTADYFDTLINELGDGQARLCCNWTIVELNGALNKSNLSSICDSPVSAHSMALLLKRISDQTISGKIAKTVFQAMWDGEGSADEIIEKKGLKQISDSDELETVIQSIINDNPQQLEQYRAGQTKLIQFFVGQVMKATRGKANPGQVNQLLKKILGE